MRFRIQLYPGFDELDAIGPFEVLSMAVRHGAPWLVELSTIDGGDEVRASNGLRVRVAPTDDAVPDVLIIPGGGWVDRGREGARTAYERGDGPGTVAGAARHAHESGAIVASVCTGAMLLARAGLLHGRRCITHRAAIQDLEGHGGVIVRTRVVDDGELLTAGGVTSGIDLAIHLVERFAGAPLADRITEILEYPRVRAACA
jgi:transcriptional regulator GlxA family with amidase domain